MLLIPGFAWGAEPTDPEAPGLELLAFIDAYAAYQTAGNGTLATLSGHRAISGQGANGRAESGLSLAFVGLDASYDAGPFGLVANVRLGQGSAIFHRRSNGESDESFGIAQLAQAYAVLRPERRLQFDLGMFLSPFGVEGLDSFRNANYTRGVVYWYGQPSWHMGLNAKWKFDSGVNLMGLVVDGSNNISTTQQSSGLKQAPTLGGAIGYAPNEDFSITLGGLTALDQNLGDNAGFEQFLDLSFIWRVDRLTTWINGDFVATSDAAPDGSDRHLWGACLINQFRITDAVAVAARGELLQDDVNFGDADVWRLVTGTLTLDVAVAKGPANLLIRWENRAEYGNQRIFGKDSRGTEEPSDDSYQRAWFETLLGVVVSSQSRAW